jgi:hypothetical protein
MGNVLSYLISNETKRAHRATWFVYAGGYGTPTEKIRHTSQMRGSWAGYDVACSCGWESKTGGATKASVEDELFDHRHDAQTEAALHAEARAAGVDPDDTASYIQFLRDKLAKGE